MKKLAVITGCNRGVGEGIRNQLLNAGYYVYGINRTPTEGVEKINYYTEYICDVSNAEKVKEICSKIKKQKNHIDLLVLNAGIRKFGKISELSIEDFSYSIDVNLKGPFYVITSLLEQVKNANGNIVFIGSHAGRYPFGLGSAYCSSKRGVEALAECLMEEVRRDGIKVIHLSLGAIKNRDHGYEEEWKIKPEEIGDAILKLLDMPQNLLFSDINLRPQAPKQMEIEGIELMQYK